MKHFKNRNSYFLFSVFWKKLLQGRISRMMITEVLLDEWDFKFQQFALLIFRTANHLAGFYMMATLAFNELAW